MKKRNNRGGCLLAGIFTWALTGSLSAQIFSANVGSPNNENPGSIGKYDLSGSVIDAELIAAGDGRGFNDVVVAGGTLFTLSADGASGAGTVGSYQLDGTPINASLITGLTGFSSGLAVVDGRIYVSSGSNGTIGAYGLDGSVIDATLISGLSARFSS